MGILCKNTPTVTVDSVVLPAVKSVNWTGLGRETVDVTSFDSSGWKQYVAGLKDAGSLTVECEYIPDNAQQKYASGGALYGFYADTAVSISCAWPNAAGSTTTWSCSGFLTGAEPTASVGETLKIRFDYKLTGVPTLA